MGYKTFFFYHLKGLYYCCTGKRIAAIGGAVISRNETLCRSPPSKKCSDRYTLSKGLGRSKHVRHYTILLKGIKASCPAQSALYLIQDHKHAALIAKLSYTFYKLRICRVDPAFSLNSFHDYSYCFVIYKCLYTFQIIVLCKSDARDHGTEGFLIVFITRYCKSPHGTAVKRMVHGDDLVIISAVLHKAVFFSQLHSSLNSLGSAVCKKDFVHSRPGSQYTCCLRHRLIVEIVGCMYQLVYLIL